MSVDFPAFGKPTRPTSASSFSWSRRFFSSPGRPGSTLRGARLVDVANCAFPRPPRPPLAIEHVILDLREVGDLRVPVGLFLEDDRSHRHFERDVLARAAGAVRSLAVLAAAGFEEPLKTEIEQCIQVRVDREIHVSARSAVAPVGSTARHELLAPEAQGSASAVAGSHANIDFIYKHGGRRASWWTMLERWADCH